MHKLLKLRIVKKLDVLLRFKMINVSTWHSWFFFIFIHQVVYASIIAIMLDAIFLNNSQSVNRWKKHRLKEILNTRSVCVLNNFNLSIGGDLSPFEVILDLAPSRQDCPRIE